MKKFHKLFAAMAVCVMLCGCAGNTGAGATTDATTTPPETEETPTSEMTMKDYMVANSLMSTGNNYRIKKFIEKARAGEDVTLGFIGGSITEGYNAGTDKIYAKLTYEYFAETFGTGDNVHYVNAGLSGTPSMLGLIRSERDLFKYNPDIVFIEFAVNDGQSPADKAAFESLIRRALNQPNEPAVILLFSVVESGYTCQDVMNLVSFKYDLAKISVKDAIWPYITGNQYTWKEWSNDDAHPNKEGCELYASFIINYFETVDKEPAAEGYFVPDSVTQYDNSAIQMVDNQLNTDRITIETLGSFKDGSNHAKFKNGWTRDTDANESMKFTFTGDTFFVVYKDTTSASYGSAEVYVDGQKAGTLMGNSSDGWNNPVTERMFRSGEVSEHTVEIRMAEGDEDKEFMILCFGIN